MMMVISMIMSLIFFSSQLNTPISMIFMAIISTLFMSTYHAFLFSSSWIFYLFCLLMLGGMMVIFIYMAAINSNAKFESDKKKLLLPVFFPFCVLFIFKVSFLSSSMKMTIFSLNCLEITQFNFILSMLFYLLLGMTLILNMTSFFKTPLRPIF